VANAIAQGRLVSPFDIAVGQHFAYYFVTPEATSGRPAVQAFRSWLLEESQSEATRRTL
jgi:LysR family glycine cleavage system transcriptional activator